MLGYERCLYDVTGTVHSRAAVDFDAPRRVSRDPTDDESCRWLGRRDVDRDKLWQTATRRRQETSEDDEFNGDNTRTVAGPVAGCDYCPRDWLVCLRVSVGLSRVAICNFLHTRRYKIHSVCLPVALNSPEVYHPFSTTLGGSMLHIGATTLWDPTLPPDLPPGALPGPHWGQSPQTTIFWAHHDGLSQLYNRGCAKNVLQTKRTFAGTTLSNSLLPHSVNLPNIRNLFPQSHSPPHQYNEHTF